MSPLSVLSSPCSLLVLSLCVLSGCAHNCCEVVTTTTTTETVTSRPACGPNCPPSIDNVATPRKLTAVGYGAIGNYAQYSTGQQKLMAMRAAQVDAYRNLAEQVYGFRIAGNTAVSAFATQSDSVKTYVDAAIRGARVVGVTSMTDGNYEATVELELAPQFFDCLSRPSTCGGRSSVAPSMGRASTSSSATYVSY